ncbi:hypothetical protein AREALGSMS7_01144 [Arenibacter algicola]|uniref:Uncharacterized protein n=1 Tax=Arenibacter algicola TaxID=616991 RepID=A0A221UTA1_9FLAO|nr:hypothetical protein AREALGSMS7_01144 [Arenibacter algicola]
MLKMVRATALILISPPIFSCQMHQKKNMGNGIDEGIMEIPMAAAIAILGLDSKEVN